MTSDLCLTVLALSSTQPCTVHSSPEPCTCTSCSPPSHCTQPLCSTAAGQAAAAPAVWLLPVAWQTPADMHLTYSLATQLILEPPPAEQTGESNLGIDTLAYSLNEQYKYCFHFSFQKKILESEFIFILPHSLIRQARKMCTMHTSMFITYSAHARPGIWWASGLHNSDNHHPPDKPYPIHLSAVTVGLLGIVGWPRGKRVGTANTKSKNIEKKAVWRWDEGRCYSVHISLIINWWE